MEPIWPRVEELFCSALQQPESERETWVASQAGFDPEVREEARSRSEGNEHGTYLAARGGFVLLRAATTRFRARDLGCFASRIRSGGSGRGAVPFGRGP